MINLFNLLPVVPLDGGRVVKSITHQANRAGQRARGRHARVAEADARIPAAKPPLRPRASQAAFACYAGLAILLWLFMLAIGNQPGAVAAMHALQG